jgi:hypothetical protein
MSIVRLLFPSHVTLRLEHVITQRSPSRGCVTLQILGTQKLGTVTGVKSLDWEFYNEGVVFETP